MKISANRELIEAAMMMLSATGTACTSWPMGSPKRVSWTRLDQALRVVANADPYNGTTESAVNAYLDSKGDSL